MTDPAAALSGGEQVRWGPTAMIETLEVDVSIAVHDIVERGLWAGPLASTDDFLHRAARLLARVRDEGVLRPRAVIGRFGVRSGDADGLELDNGLRLAMRLPEHYRPHCRQIASAVATIGPACEKLASRFMAQGRVLDGFVLDAVGSAAVEMVVIQANARIEAMAASEGMGAYPAFTPGCPGLDLDQQSVVCRMVRAETIGVKLFKGAMMSPVKSTSLVVPLGSPEPDRPEFNLCAQCSHRSSCLFRRHDR